MPNRTVRGYRTVGNTNEQVVNAGPCILHGVRPELTTTGTITLRNQATAAGGSDNIYAVTAIGLTQAGKDFNGILFPTGLTVQLSAGTDLSMIIWEAA